MQQTQLQPPINNVYKIQNKSFVYRIFILFLISIFSLVCLTTLLCGLTISTTTGSRILWFGIKKASGNHLHGKFIKGTWLSGGTIENFVFDNKNHDDKGMQVNIDHLQWKWGPNYKPWRWTIEYLRLGVVDISVDSRPKMLSSKKELGLFQIQVPVTVSSIYIQRLHFKDNPASPPMSFFPTFEFRGMTDQTLSRNLLNNECNEIHASATFSNQSYKINIKRASWFHGNIKGHLSLDTSAAFNIIGNFEYVAFSRNQTVNSIKTNLQNPNLKLNLNISGSLRKLLIQLKGSGVKGSKVEGEVLLMLYDDFLFDYLVFKCSHINPHFFFKNFPNADLTIDFSLRPHTLRPFSSNLYARKIIGNISVYNFLTGKLDSNLLPITGIDLSFILEGKHLWHINLLRCHVNNDTVISGNGLWSVKNGGSLNFKVRYVNAHSFFNFLESTQLNGDIKLTGDITNQYCYINLFDGKSFVKLEANFLKKRRKGKTFLENFQVNHLHFQGEGGFLFAQGTLIAENNQQNYLSVILHRFDPLFFIRKNIVNKYIGSQKTESLKKNIKFTVLLSGTLNFQRFIDINSQNLINRLIINCSNSTYGDLPLYIKGTVQFKNYMFLKSNLVIQICDNHIQLLGKFSDDNDCMQLKIDAPHCDKFGFGFSGQVLLKIIFSRQISGLSIHVQYKLHYIAITQYRITYSIGDIKFSTIKDNPLEWVSIVNDISSPIFVLDQVTIKLYGSQAKHNLCVLLKGEIDKKIIDFETFANGRIRRVKDRLEWQGVVYRLINKQDILLQICRETSLILRSDGFEMGVGDLEIFGAHIIWSFFQVNRYEITSIGYIHNVCFSQLLRMYSMTNNQALVEKLDCLLDLDWNFSIKDTTSQGFVILRQSEYAMRRKKHKNNDNLFDLETLQVFLKFSKDKRIHLTIHCSKIHYGFFLLDISFSFNNKGMRCYLEKNKSISGDISIDLPDLEKMNDVFDHLYHQNIYLSDKKIIFKGSLLFKTKISGTWKSPKFFGSLIGKNLSLNRQESGYNFHTGAINIVLNEKNIEFRRVTFQSGKGHLNLTGKINFLHDQPAKIDLHVKVNKLTVFNLPKKQLIISGEGKIQQHLKQRGICLNGDIIINHALFDAFQFFSSQLEQRSEYFIDNKKFQKSKITNIRAKKQFLHDFFNNFFYRIHVIIDLGQDFIFQDQGSKFNLMGQLFLHSPNGEGVHGHGEFRMAEGSMYHLMGRKFRVEKGVVTFSDFNDIPSLNLSVIRRNQIIPAGINIQGKMSNPKIDVISEPSDIELEEKLSWMLFGYSSKIKTRMSHFYHEFINQAATVLVGRFFSQYIVDLLGFDGFLISLSENGQETLHVLHTSKSVKDQITMRYEYGLNGRQYLNQFILQLSKFLSLGVHMGYSEFGNIRGYVLEIFNRFD